MSTFFEKTRKPVTKPDPLHEAQSIATALAVEVRDLRHRVAELEYVVGEQDKTNAALRLSSEPAMLMKLAGEVTAHDALAHLVKQNALKESETVDVRS